MSEWSDGNAENFEGMLRKVGIGVAVFTVIAGAFLAGQRALTLATQKLAPSMSHGAARELNASPYGDPGRVASVPRFSPGLPSAYARASYSAPPPPLVPPSAAALAASGGPFTSEAERDQGRQSLSFLSDVVATTRRSDGRTLWQAPPTQTGSSTASDVPKADSNVTPEGSDSHAPPTTNNITENAARFADRINDEADGIAAQMAIAAHPGRFPLPMRDGVGEVSRELNIYLQTTRLAALASPTERQRLQPLAQKHLARSEEALHNLEALVGGMNGTAGTSAN